MLRRLAARLVMRLGDHEQCTREPILISAKAVGPQAVTQQRKTLVHMPSLDLYQPIIEAPRYCVISEALLVRERYQCLRRLPKRLRAPAEVSKNAGDREGGCQREWMRQASSFGDGC